MLSQTALILLLAAFAVAAPAGSATSEDFTVELTDSLGRSHLLHNASSSPDSFVVIDSDLAYAAFAYNNDNASPSGSGPEKHCEVYDKEMVKIGDFEGAGRRDIHPPSQIGQFVCRDIDWNRRLVVPCDPPLIFCRRGVAQSWWSRFF